MANDTHTIFKVEFIPFAFNLHWSLLIETLIDINVF